MKKGILFLALFLLLFKYSSYAQQVTDSTKIGLTFKTAPWYVRAMPISLYTGITGKYADRIPQYIEVGKSFRVIDLGLALGRSSLRPDSTLFTEVKVTMDVCNYGIFANEMTIGGGKLFDHNGSIMLELSYTIFAQLGPKWGLGLVSGYYDYTSETVDNSRVFYGLFFRYGIQRTDSGGLFGLGRGRGRSGRGHGHGR
ncbi:hypothetical protein SAMN04515674_101188 [Pseudarcicella hirudinis]|uniref:Outer membrane protein beta-barrel domain-containing protein n=1 Tax=Pseudarcicella hirudinis TaxID=1079859 RepID=A0A1I5M8V3_9BACT|nr:hypothetical protein [Pseudarcicella hirudinis]SFP05969.1 hypothetical protein SAMN04515674_101188 [Pseudarcicella hirudinis]